MSAPFYVLTSVYRLIPSGWKGRFWAMVGLATFVAVLETLGVASIMPFVALLADPAVIQRSLERIPFAHAFAADIVYWPVHWVGVAVIVLFVATNFLGFASLWLSVYFSTHLGIRISRDLVERYLQHGYLHLRMMGTGAAANDVTREVEKLAGGGVLQLCLLISKSVQVVFVVLLLLLVSPLFTLVFCSVTSLLYLGIYRFLRKPTARAGEQAMTASAEAAQLANELFSAAKDILVRRKEEYFLDRLAEVCIRFYKADALSRILPVVPKYAIETIAFTSLLLLPVYRSIQGEEYRSLLPVIALFAYAGYRILPALQQAYHSFAMLKFYEALAKRISLSLQAVPQRRLSSGCRSDFRSEIQLVEVSYQYESNQSHALSSVSLAIRRGEKLAVVGPSGSGKSTLLDILSGLVPITSGALCVDGQIVSERFCWHNAVGYVSQSPIIMTDTVCHNIALGEPPASIDLERCKVVARLAGIDSVIESLPQGYQTRIGGQTSLSGGESQRLAIARALYHAPALVLMDEPSSALDPGLAEQIMARLCDHDPSMTVIVVTHDWKLLRFFDRVVIMDKGRVVADGTFEKLQDRLERLRVQYFAKNSQASIRMVE